MTTTATGYNSVVTTRYRAGWIGLFSGENQSRAVQRALTDINGRGLKCTGLVHDQWNFFVRLWWLLIAVITLGFYVRVPNVVIVTEPLSNSQVPPPPPSAQPPTAWYPDPHNPAQLRWWDGQRFTEHTQPAQSQQPGAPNL